MVFSSRERGEGRFSREKRGSVLSQREEYVLELSVLEWDPLVSGKDRLHLRAAELEDTTILAELMLAAYHGTTDDEGETLEEAIEEVDAYLAGDRGGEALLRESRLAFVGPLLVGACLLAEWEERQVPLVAYVMTRKEWKRRQIARQVLGASLLALTGQDYHEIRAVITKGNIPSERLFESMGFQKDHKKLCSPLYH